MRIEGSNTFPSCFKGLDNCITLMNINTFVDNYRYSNFFSEDIDKSDSTHVGLEIMD